MHRGGREGSRRRSAETLQVRPRVAGSQPRHQETQWLLWFSVSNLPKPRMLAPLPNLSISLVSASNRWSFKIGGRRNGGWMRKGVAGWGGLRKRFYLFIEIWVGGNNQH